MLHLHSILDHAYFTTICLYCYIPVSVKVFIIVSSELPCIYAYIYKYISVCVIFYVNSSVNSNFFLPYSHIRFSAILDFVPPGSITIVSYGISIQVST